MVASWGEGGEAYAGTVSDLSFVTIILKKTARNMREEVFP